MINMISTGNSSVDAVGMMDLTGNMIPNNWYNHVLRDNGKPNYLAILLLSEIVYWYKPVEIRDDETGKTIGYRKKFKSDCLQKSYDQLGSKFGEEKHTVKRALDCLEDLGVIKREFRTIKVGEEEKKINNVLYIHLIPDGIRRITFGDGSVDNSDPVDKSVDTLPTNLSIGCEQICEEAPNKSVETNTENTTEITDKEYYNPINLSMTGSTGNTTPEKTMDRMDEINTYREMIRDYIEYDDLMDECHYSSEREVIDEIYELICETVCMNGGTVRIGGQDMPYQIVKSMFLKLTKDHVKYVRECLVKSSSKVGNMRAYLLTALYRAPQTYKNSFDQKVRSDMADYVSHNNNFTDGGGAAGDFPDL